MSDNVIYDYKNANRLTLSVARGVTAVFMPGTHSMPRDVWDKLVAISEEKDEKGNLKNPGSLKHFLDSNQIEILGGDGPGNEDAEGPQPEDETDAGSMGAKDAVLAVEGLMTLGAVEKARTSELARSQPRKNVKGAIAKRMEALEKINVDIENAKKENQDNQD